MRFQWFRAVGVVRRSRVEALGNKWFERNYYHVIRWWIFNGKLTYFRQRATKNERIFRQFFSTVTLNKYFNKPELVDVILWWLEEMWLWDRCKYLCVHLLSYLFINYRATSRTPSKAVNNVLLKVTQMEKKGFSSFLLNVFQLLKEAKPVQGKWN